MKRFWLIALCALLLLSMTACGNKNQDDGSTAATDEQEGSPVYALDPIINRFFVDFIEMHKGQSLDTRSIRRGAGNADTKPEDLTKEYHAVINGHNVTLRNATYEVENDKGVTLTMYQLRVIIEGGTTKKSFETLMSTFKMIAPVCDPDCSTTAAERAVEAMEKMTKTGSYRVSDFLKVENYTPIVEEYGVPAKIEMVAYNYQPLETE